MSHLPTPPAGRNVAHGHMKAALPTHRPKRLNALIPVPRPQAHTNPAMAFAVVARAHGPQTPNADVVIIVSNPNLPPHHNDLLQPVINNNLLLLHATAERAIGMLAYPRENLLPLIVAAIPIRGSAFAVQVSHPSPAVAATEVGAEVP